MAVFSILGWDNYIKQSIGLSGDHFLTEACVFPKLPRTGEANWLPARYAILGLYKAGVEIDNTQRSRQLAVGLFAKDWQGNEQKFGYLELWPKTLLLGCDRI